MDLNDNIFLLKFEAFKKKIYRETSDGTAIVITF